MEDDVQLIGGGRTPVSRRGDVVPRKAGPWSSTVVALLRHLEHVGFANAPRVVGSGFDDQGRETLGFIEGDFVHPCPWPDEALPIIGTMLRRLHEATASFVVPMEAVWQPWFGRSLGRSPTVIGHCDTGPWNIVAVGGLPAALIDWEAAGPVDPTFELAQACSLNAQLHDDDIAEKVGLASPEHRAKHVRLLLDGYGMASAERAGFVDKMMEFAIHDAADQAIQAGVAMDSRDDDLLWAIAWRTRSGRWMLRNRAILERALD